jgi:DNA-binding PadR family transcriptional regulator
MGKSDVLDVLKKNPNKYFSTEELAVILHLNVQTMYSLLKKLVEENTIMFKDFTPSQGPSKKLYAYTHKDDYFEEVLHQFNTLKSESRFTFMPPEVLANLLVVKEIKQLREGLQK